MTTVALVRAVGTNGAERRATQPMKLENGLNMLMLNIRRGIWIRGGHKVNVAFLADSHLATEMDHGVGLCVRVEGEVVEATIGEAVAVVFHVLFLCDQVRFRQGGDTAVCAAAAGAET